MLNLTTSRTVENITRLKALSARLGTEIVAGGTEVPVVVCEVQFRPLPGEFTEAEQRARAYGATQTLTIRNGQCDTCLFNTDTRANPYTGALVRGQITVANGYDQVVSAIQTGSANGMLNRVETTLASMGCIPAGT